MGGQVPASSAIAMFLLSTRFQMVFSTICFASDKYCAQRIVGVLSHTIPALEGFNKIFINKIFIIKSIHCVATDST